MQVITSEGGADGSAEQAQGGPGDVWEPPPEQEPGVPPPSSRCRTPDSRDTSLLGLNKQVFV